MIAYIVDYKEKVQEGNTLTVKFISDVVTSEEELQLLKQKHPGLEWQVVHEADYSLWRITKEELLQEVLKQDTPSEEYIKNMTTNQLTPQYISLIYQIQLVSFYWNDIANFDEVVLELLKDKIGPDAEAILAEFNDVATDYYNKSIKEALCTARK